MTWTSKSLENALNINIEYDIEAKNIQFNSIDIKKDDIFIALSGNRNGHEFVKDALSRGAKCAIVSQYIENVNPKRIIQVANTNIALKCLAKYKRMHSNARFIAVTGSVGKTTTREIIKTMLLPHGKTYSTAKNFNNYLGTLLTLASIPNNVKYVVMELGMNASNEIRCLTNIINILRVYLNLC